MGLIAALDLDWVAALDLMGAMYLFHIKQ